MTLTETTANKLIQLIKDRHLNPGDKLPTEVDLSQQLDVGRNTLREAQKILVSRNIITIRQGAGSFVSQNPGVVDDPLGFTC